MAKKKGFLDGYETYDTSDGFGDPDQWRNAFYQRMGKQGATAFLKEQNETPHAVLGVKEGATLREIKAAFRQLMMEWHPDRNGHRIDEADVMTKKILAAAKILL